MSHSNGNNGRRGKKKTGRIVFLVEVILLIALAAGIFVFARISDSLRSIGSGTGNPGNGVTGQAVSAGDGGAVVSAGGDAVTAGTDGTGTLTGNGGSIGEGAVNLQGRTQVTPDPNFDADAAEENLGVSQNQKLKGYTNIALIGIDSRNSEQIDYANSDTMIVASINNGTGMVRMISLYRDTLLNIGTKSGAEESAGGNGAASVEETAAAGAEAEEAGAESEVRYASNDEFDEAALSEESNDFSGSPEPDGHYNKANAAYANGSAKQLLTMLNRNLDLNIHDYIVVDFNGVAKLVDDIDGIDVWMTEQEVIHMNNYCVETSQVTGLAYEPVEPQKDAQYYHLNGVQAVSYARIRYTTGSDMKRTQRQRVVIEKVVSKAKSKGIQTVQAMIRDVFPLCRTSLSSTEIIRLASQMFSYEIEKTSGFPFEHLEKNVTCGSRTLDAVVPVTLAENVSELHEFLFDEENYEVSATVAEYSADIERLSNLTEKSRESAIENSVIGMSGGEADIVT